MTGERLTPEEFFDRHVRPTFERVAAELTARLPAGYVARFDDRSLLDPLVRIEPDEDEPNGA